MKRRNFLKQGALFAVVVGGQPSSLLSMPARWGKDLLPPLTCLPTTEDILGPFYRANAPFRTDLTIPGQPGTVFHLHGKVISSNCPGPLNAVVDIWQADDAGAYDNNSPAYNYRGRQNTDANGDYSFDTILPGRYLNGAQYRPSHIHFRVTAPNHEELITQLYFQGDPYIPIDPWASDPDAALRILPVEEISGEMVLNFEIILQALPSSTLEQKNQGVIEIIPQRPAGKIFIKAMDTELEAVEVFATNGDMVLRAYKLSGGEISLDAGMLPKGVYLIRVKTKKGIFVEKVVWP